MASNDVQVGVSFNKDDVSAGISKVSSTIKSAASTMGNIGSAALDGIKNLALGIGAAATAAATGIAAIGKKSIEAYASFEQLAGGVETLFGAGGKTIEEYAASVGKAVWEIEEEYDSLMQAQSTVMKNAKEAYETAGMSANEYMETVTSFSASLIASLDGDTQEAAKQADMAITDMSDNANKMGTSLESLQNAYAGFAKQNYTMLDNLKIGYGGTKEEMQRLLRDAQAISGIEYDISSFNDVVSAIHVIQTQIGITGTTAKEANETIEGSARAMKAAFENLLVGFADENQNVGDLIESLIDRVQIYLSNLLPRIQEFIRAFIASLPQLIEGIKEVGRTIFTAIVEAVQENGGQFAEVLSNVVTSAMHNLAAIIKTMLPVAVQALQSFISSFAEFVASEDFADIISALFDAVTMIAAQLFDLTIQYIPQLVEYVLSTIRSVFEMVVSSDFSQIVDNLVSKLVEMFSSVFQLLAEYGPQIGSMALDMLKKVFTTIADLIKKVDLGAVISSVLQVIGDVLGAILEALPDIIATIFDTLSSLIKSIDIQGIIEGIFSIIENIFTHLPDIIMAILEGIGSIIEAIIDLIVTTDWIAVGAQIIEGLLNGLLSLATGILDFFGNLLGNIVDAIVNTDWIGTAGNIVQGLLDGLANLPGMLWDCIVGGVEDAVQGMKDFLGIESPSKLMFGIGKYVTEGLVRGLEYDSDKIEDLAMSMARGIEDAFAIDNASITSSIKAASISGGSVVNNVVQTYTVGNVDVTNNEGATTAIDALCNAMDIYSRQRPVFVQ